MRTGTLVVGIVLLIGPCSRADEFPLDPWRVVVQDASLEPLAVSEQGPLIAARGRWSRHVFHVFDRESSLILLTVHLTHPIQAAAIAPDGEWFAVSTVQNVYRIGLADGSIELLLDGTGGAVALDGTGERLAVLGRLGDEDDGRRLMDAARLGVYDLQQNRWVAQADTPILINHLVTFDGSAVLAAGHGGRVFHRAGSSFPCHVRLEPETGQVTFGRGPETPDRFHAAAEADPGYVFPEVVQAKREFLAETVAAFSAPQDRIGPTSVPRHGENFALTATDDSILAVTDRGARQISLLTLYRNGPIEVRAVEFGFGGVGFCGGRLLSQRWGEERNPVVDLQTDEDVFAVPRFDSYDGRHWVQFVPAGCLVRQGDQLEFYHPDHRERRWVREVPAGLDNGYLLSGSPDGSRLALGPGGNSADLLFVLSAETGETIARIPRPEDPSGRFSGYARHAFSRDGNRLAVLLGREVRVFDIATGELRYRDAAPRDDHIWSAVGMEHGWLLGADSWSQFFDEERGPGAVVSLANIEKAHSFSMGDRTALLTESKRGRGAVITEEGTVLRSWVLGVDLPDLGPGGPPLAAVAFGGRFLVRFTGATAVELIDALTLDLVATVHILKSANDFGWVAYTPDGFWDASPGAEQHLAVFRGRRHSALAEAQTRRVESLLQQRLRR